ncbi:hypothetical protein P8452_19839 [Trifolium repens]|nr:hypothetical protein P8452_19839 [Trifolium repens]
MKVLEHFYTEDHRVNKVNQLQRPCDDVPIFHNLTHLELHNRWDLVVQVLHQCPKLQNLRLYKGLSDSMGHEDFINQENWCYHIDCIGVSEKQLSLFWWLLER